MTRNPSKHDATIPSCVPVHVYVLTMSPDDPHSIPGVYTSAKDAKDRARQLVGESRLIWAMVSDSLCPDAVYAFQAEMSGISFRVTCVRLP